MSNKNLVTIAVLTYNSSKTVLDTLDSIAKQTYPNIELIISDDGSLDSTVALVNKWIKTNSSKFIKSQVITVEKNTGIPANCNRALKAANGKWIKFIAGDDLLLPNCIEDFINFTNIETEANVVYSNYYKFISDKNNNIKIIGPKLDNKINDGFNVPPDKQLYYYIEKGFNISPATFIKVEFAKSIGFIEKYKYFEDTPFYVRVLKSGNKIYFLHKYTVLYRSDGNSVTREKNRTHFYKQNFVDSYLSFRKDIIYSLYSWYNLHFWIKEYSFILQYKLTIKILKNKRTRMNLFFYYFFKILNPYYLTKFLLRKS